MGKSSVPSYTSGGVIQDLGLPVGEATAIADAISDSGEIIGCSFSLDRASSGFVDNGGTLQDIGTLNGGIGATSQANGVNASGQIVGYSSIGDNLTALHAILYSGGVIQDLGTLPGGLNSQGLGINASGQVAGWSGVNSTTADPHSHAIIYSNGIMLDLGTLPGGADSLAQSINASGTVVGSASTASGVWHAMLDSGGVMRDLGTLPGGVSSFATSINDGGQVVGSSKAASGDLQPFLYSGGTMLRLNSLISPSSGWVLNTALGINNAGQIVGQGTLNGRAAGFLLTPVIDAAIFTTQPPTIVSGTNQPFSMAVSAYNSAGKVDTTFNGTITLAIATGPAGATLGGTLTQNAVNGVANFAGLTLNNSGTYTLRATGKWLVPANTKAFNVALPSPPANSVPGPQTSLRNTVNPNGTLVFSSASDNPIIVNDQAVGTGAARALIHVAHGKLKLGTTTGVAIVGGANNSMTVMIQGTISAINTALRGLTYTPQVQFTGSETLTLVSSDLGHTTLGVAQTATSQIAISVGSTTPSVGYSLTDLGTLGGSSSYANAINSSGQVVGWSTTLHGDWHAMFYSGGVMQDLGVLNLSPYSFGLGINDNGQTVGFNQQTIGITQAFLASGGVMQNLGLGPNPLLITSEAFGINNNGDVVGTSNTSTGAGPYAFLFSNGNMQYLGTLPGGTQSEAIALNANDQVVGLSYDSNGQPHAFLYSNGLMQDLGMLPGGTQSQANAINDIGLAAGYSTISDGHKHAFVASGGAMLDLGTLPGGADSEANGINASGQVVGHSTAASGSEHAFVDSGSVMQDLNALIAPSSGWLLNIANGINAAGQIVGQGTVGGAIHAFLLTPVPAAAAASRVAPAINANTTNLQFSNSSSGTRNLSTGVTSIAAPPLIGAANAPQSSNLVSQQSLATKAVPVSPANKLKDKGTIQDPDHGHDIALDLFFALLGARNLLHPSIS